MNLQMSNQCDGGTEMSRLVEMNKKTQEQILELNICVHICVWDLHIIKLSFLNQCKNY